MRKDPIASRRFGGESAGRRIFACLAALAITSVIPGTVGIAAGQSQQGKLEYGVIYSCPQMNNYEFKVISCDDKDWCQVFMVNKVSPHGGNISGESKSTVLSTIERGECNVKGGSPAARANPAQAASGNKQGSAPARDAATSAAACSSDPGLTAKPKAGDSMELSSKRAILARFHQSVEKGEKLAVGITFESYLVGPPRTNRRGDTLYFEDAPVGAKVYPVKSKFTLCSRFSTEITRDVIDGRYECFKDNFSEWSCATASGYRVVNTRYEKLKK